jgi:hypothetical protein
MNIPIDFERYEEVPCINIITSCVETDFDKVKFRKCMIAIPTYKVQN